MEDTHIDSKLQAVVTPKKQKFSYVTIMDDEFW